ncbi:Probable RNA-directed DNA polymerase from transposon BS [Eumeta japonica]|uniref:Probable RNA-directed DNA polymerase from transposon BS n=1 Tax=Eumeta variegata TaxID=151549 RepID=A0A4C1YI43_EUMVA|nr:Probable RNA-directed DNA polymerase from transposon BS [Eumeta japonica]
MEATGCRLAMTGHSTIVIVSVYLPSPKPLLRSDLRALLGLGDAVILFGDFNCKNPRWGCAVMDENGEKLDRFQDRLEFEVVAPSTATYFPHNDTYRTSTLDIALTKGVDLNLNSIEPLHRFSSDHRPVLLKMGPPDGGRPVSTVKITDWKRVSTAFEKIDTPPLNSILDDISTIEQIDHAIGALTSHVRTVVEKCERELFAARAHILLLRIDPEREREISLLSGLAKLFEKVLKTRLSNHLSGKGLIIDEQFGFRPAHSCPQQVLRLVEYVMEGFKTKQKTVCVFFDVAKAFDRVWHAGLVYKLYSLEVPDRLIFIIQNFLSNRYFTFRHERTHSTRRLIRAGVPQGSALSPLLYSAYTNDIPRPTSGVQLALFADDTALFLRSRTRRSILRHLPKAINELGQWFRKWRIEVNPDKSAAIQFKYSKNRS